MTRSIDISLSAQTIDALKDEGFALYVLKAVRYGFRGVSYPSVPSLKKAISPATAGGAPVIARVLTTYLSRTTIEWEPAVQAYISTSPIAEQQRIFPDSMAAADLGQTVNVDQNGGLSVTVDGGQGAVSIRNQGTTRWTCGLAQKFRADLAPICAFPLHGKGMDVLTPVDKVLLMFAPNLLPVGAVCSTAYSPAFLVDAAGDRSVSFDVNEGWATTEVGATWARSVEPEDDLGPLLIIST